MDRGAFWLLLMAMTVAHAQERSAGTTSCPAVSGHYRLAGSQHAVDDALKVLGVRLTGSKENDVWLSGRPEDGLSVSVAGRGRDMPSSPGFVLRHGTSFLCKDGWLVFDRIANARRETEKGWYQGESVVRIGPSAGGALGIEIDFTGRQSITLLQYETTLSVPKPFSGTSFRETLQWPAVPEIQRVAPASDAPSPEPREVHEVRAMLDDKLLGNVTLRALHPSGDAVLAALNARSNEDVAGLEDRMRAASIHYAMKVPPRWAGNRYDVDLSVWPTGARTAPAVRPSAHRVEQELLRSQIAMVSVRKVDDVGDGYVATLSIPGTDTVDSVIARLKANTKLFADIRPLSESERTGTPTSRVAQIKLWAR